MGLFPQNNLDYYKTKLGHYEWKTFFQTHSKIYLSIDIERDFHICNEWCLQP